MGKEKLSYVHRGGDQPLLGSTIPSLFTEIVASFPDHEAIVSIPQKIRLTYAAIQHEIRCLAKALIALGISKSERVGIWSTNNLEWVLLQMATAHVGAVLVNINPAYRPRDLKHALERAQVQALFLIPSFKTSKYVDMVCELCPGA
ncbi:MAG: AMP-binding protein, partial [Nitrospirales bacterium]|nr:AMP-binding protein [Nitrospirales bacterium]